MRWYRAAGRHQLPWRLTRDSYAVLVSEVMLQQTQVDRVRPYYEAWLSRWPDFAALAAAPVSEVIRAWRGLGYNRRALNLHRLAVAVTERHQGNLPLEPNALLSLPGVGPYTASAVRCFAREEHVTVADTNIARVASRALLGAASQREVTPRSVSEALSALLPAHNARDHNLALMDLGATICHARTPECGICPLASQCAWRLAGHPVAKALRPPAPRFETTARYARGRIINALRESPLTTEELTAMLPNAHQPHLTHYLAALQQEGLITNPAGAWQLPE